MQPRTATAARCIIAALALGVLADALLRVGPWGLNATVYLSVFAACLLGFAKNDRKWIGLLILLFGLFFVWRDSRVLKALDILAVGTLCITIVLPDVVTRITRSSFVHYVVALCDSAGGAIAGLPLLANLDLELRGRRATPDNAKGQWRHVLTNSTLGLVIAFPLIVVFGGLFASADVAFHNFIQHALDLNWDEIISHVLVVGMVFWIVAGYLRVVAISRRTDLPADPSSEAIRLDTLALLIPLVLLNVLFIAFVCVQFEYFFGGNALINDPSGPTYSAYAREGFFQLVAVAVLALLVLYAADWLNRGANPYGQKWFRILAVLLIILVYIVMASALHRMYLYYQAYGLTQLRFYTTVFMLWLALVIVLFVVTVLAVRRDRFLFSAIAAGWIAIAVLHAINPDAVIAKANVVRMADGKPLDSRYLGRELSADAIPELLHARKAFTGAERDAIDWVIVSWLGSESRKYQDVRNWNWAASYATSDAVRLEIDTWAKDAIETKKASELQDKP